MKSKLIFFLFLIFKGAGKTLIAAMLSVHMKEINPDKKIIFITDRIPLVFQQALYLREQTSLTVGEFCGQNKELSESQYDLDVLVFTADFLINKLHNKSLHIADCCCLIIGNIIFSKFI